MKRLGIRAILTLLAAIAVSPLAAQEEPAAVPAPKVEAVEAVKDLGIVPKGDQVQVTFELRNLGTAPLEIHEVRPACGCTVAEYDKTIAPGKTGTVRAALDTTNLYGANSKTLTVFTNDPTNAALVLTIKSDIKPYLAAVPGYARFNSVQGEVEGTVTQTLWAEDGNDFKIIKVEAPYPFTRASFREAKQEERDENGQGRQWRVDLTLASNAPVGALTKFLKITTDHPKQKSVNIPVSGFVRPVLAVSPPTANLRSFDQSEGRRSNVLLRNFATENIKVTEVKSNQEKVKVYLDTVEEGRRYRVNIEALPGMPKGPFSATVTVKTESPKVPTLDFEVKGVVN
jgi:hypothetical protein